MGGRRPDHPRPGPSNREAVLLGFGAVGLFIFLVQIIGEYLADGLGGPLALLIAGIALLLVSLVVVRLKDRAKT